MSPIKLFAAPLCAGLFAMVLPVSAPAWADPAAMAEGGCAAGATEEAQDTDSVCVVTDAASGSAAMLRSLDVLSSHGLDPAHYTAGGPDARGAWLLAATHLRGGAVDPETLAPRQEADMALAATLDALTESAGADAYRTALETFAPASPLYRALKQELQAQQGVLAGDGDTQTVSGAAARIDSLQTSLERLRWLPRDTSTQQLYANIPTFEVIAFSGEVEVSRHKAIFGELDRQTPAFSDLISHLEFSPWWNVPRSMARKDSLTKFQNDPGEVERLGYQVFNASGERLETGGIDWDAVSASEFPYRIRQAPGRDNALGQVKFMFPNKHAVYVHDTPDAGLFSQETRTFSAGCIRVEDAVFLSQWILEGTPGWDRAKIDAAIASGKETRAKLTNPMSIHIVYLTAFPDAEGSMIYAPDVYKLDSAMLPVLRRGYAE